MLLISSLEHGGAERQVVTLANNLDAAGFEATICSLSPYVPLADDLRDRGRRLVVVERRHGCDVSVVTRVSRLMRERGIQIVHAFLFDAEIVGRLAAKIAGVPVVIASERNTDYRRKVSHSICLRATRPFFDAMISNSVAGKQFNIRTLGLHDHDVFVVHNGVDTERFRPLDASHLRQELGFGPDEHVVGMVAMFKRQKRHGDFFRAAKAVLERFPSTRFVCAGQPLRDNYEGAEDYHREMRDLLEELGVSHRFAFLGNRNDMPELYNLCDAVVLPSSREGTPNALLEAMACGVPVVATSVADNARIVPDGRAGFLVPLGGVDALVERICCLLADGGLRTRMGQTAREWVAAEFSVEALARKTAAVYREALHRKHRNGCRGTLAHAVR